MNRGIFILFFGDTNFMKFDKNANSYEIGMGYTPFIFKIGLATTGVCVFYALTSVGAFFNLGRNYTHGRITTDVHETIQRNHRRKKACGGGNGNP